MYSKIPCRTAQIAFALACFAMARTYSHSHSEYIWHYFWGILGALSLTLYWIEIIVSWERKP